MSPGVSKAILEYSTDTVTVEFSAADDGGVIARVTVYFQSTPVATLTAAPFRHTLDLSTLGRNRPGRVYATAVDLTGKISSTAETLAFMGRSRDTVTWMPLVPSRQPARRVGHTLSLDAAGQRAILFGGESFDQVPLPDVVNDTWAFDFVRDEWDSLVLANPPLERKDHGAGVVGRTLVVFMGRSLGDVVLQDYALLDLETMTWATNLGSAILSQPLRSMATISLGKRLFAFGGSSDPDYSFLATDSTLRYFDLVDSSWADSSAYMDSPGLRVDAMLTADLEGNRLILYGGAGASGPSVYPTNASQYHFNLNSASWIRLLPESIRVAPPLARGAAICD